MTPALGILCYHRIVRDDEVEIAWPYLERGTAVLEETFRAQLSKIESFADVFGESEALDVLAARRHLARPAVWLTFDDGYLDVKRVVSEIETATVFITTSTSERLLPADAWYALLLQASRVRGVLDLGLGPFEYDLSRRDGRARLIDGPERRAYLRAPASAREETLRDLAAQLDASRAEPALYLNAADLRGLLRRGWSIGSHGVTHTPFDSIAREEIAWEAASSRQLLLAHGGAVRSLALPDGVRGPHLSVLAATGYECALGLGDAPAEPGMSTPSRFLVPDDPRWVTRVLQPALTRGSTEVSHG